MKYRKKPVEVEAFQFDGDLINSDGEFYVPNWAREAYENGTIYFDALDSESPPTELFIKTLEGTHHTSIGDYIIQGVHGELYPCKPDIFIKTYEEVKEGLCATINIDSKEVGKYIAKEIYREGGIAKSTKTLIV